MAKRRGNGEGSVYRRGDGHVVGEWVDANGKRRYISGKTKTGVQRRLRELLADRDKGIAYDSKNLTVGDYLDRWLDAVKGSVRPRTWQRSEEVVRLHLKPTIGHHGLEKLNAIQVQAVYGQKLEVGLSPRTVEIVHATLHKALRQAVRWLLVAAQRGGGGDAPATSPAGDQALVGGAGAVSSRGSQGGRARSALGARRHDGDA